MDIRRQIVVDKSLKYSILQCYENFYIITTYLMTLPCALDGRLRISEQITFSFAQNPFVSQFIRTRANLYDGVDWQLWCNELAVVDYMWVAFVRRLQQKLDLESFLASCPWMVANSYDWIYMTPAIVVLFVNILFLVKIMWVSCGHPLFFLVSLDFSLYSRLFSWQQQNIIKQATQ